MYAGDLHPNSSLIISFFRIFLNTFSRESNCRNIEPSNIPLEVELAISSRDLPETFSRAFFISYFFTSVPRNNLEFFQVFLEECLTNILENSSGGLLGRYFRTFSRNSQKFPLEFFQEFSQGFFRMTFWKSYRNSPGILSGHPQRASSGISGIL